ncbi:AAA family ATPase [Verrucomicrobium sp. BvORR106]|uniref:ATP-dependent nuclease n=1 Tax=Verrucomicrobium sp. BvORR106 TaxID=1403819 RepID=UPI0005701D20|nr:AAA family ATPase [Verrucomicrobium sp. BvORR106]
MEIKRLRIHNFRSVSRQDISLSRLNAFVGNNDEGKSNILRSLDLFFNKSGEISGNNFDLNFCNFANVPNKKAKEILIGLTIQVPKSYSTEKQVYWEKVWRRDGIHSETMVFADFESLPQRSRIPKLLRSTRFEYVPAIKGSDYFAALLGDLYDMLAQTVEDEIRAASSSFTEAINTSSRSILEEVSRRLKIDSGLELPSNLRELFSRLEFRSKGSEYSVALSQRGDGVKVRHIPILLDFFARQANVNRVQGSVPVFTVWGYEEPENNLELSKAVELAEDFRNYASDVQILLTTHSPAFYGQIETDEDAKLYLVKNTKEKGTEVEMLQSASLPELDEQMGLLPFIAPYLKTALEEREKLAANLKKLKDEFLPTLFVEGLTDKRVFERAFEHFAPEYNGKLRVCSQTGAGVGWVKDMLVAWAHGRRSEKALGYLDCDQDGKTGKREINEHAKISSGKLARAKVLVPPKHIRSVLGKGLKLPIRLEEMFPHFCWEHARNKGWLIERKNIIQENEFSNPNLTFVEYCRSRGVDDAEMLYLLWEVMDEHKDDFSKYVCGLEADTFEGFKEIIKDIAAYFGFPHIE